MRYTTILWDWNGTLIDDVHNALDSVNDMLERKGKPSINMEQYYDYIETPIIGFYRHILTPDELDIDEIIAGYHSDYNNHLPETQLADGAEDTLEFFKSQGVKQYIITATHQNEAEELTARYGVKDYFDGILGADNLLAESKTSRAAALLKENCINPRETIFIGDTLHDLETANALGIACVLVSYGHQGRRILEESGAYVVDNMAEIKDILSDDRTVDLHTHSTYSDGTMTPKELIAHAKDAGLSAIALTDHDSVDGIKEAALEAEKLSFELIPGIEFSVASDTEIHIIGLFVDPDNETLLTTISRLKQKRKERMEDILKNLSNLGFEVTYDEALEVAGGSFVGRAHIARLMLNKGYCETIREVFDKYIGIGKPAYSTKKELTAKDAVTSIKAAGGLAFLAHLNQTGYDESRIKELLTELKAYGLDGIEGYYTEYTDSQAASYRTIAGELGLTFAGGSDFHAKMKPHIEIGVGTGNLTIPYHVLDNLKRLKERQ